MKTITPYPSRDFLRERFDYDGDTEATKNGFLMRGALVRLSNNRPVFGSVVARNDSRATIGIGGWGAYRKFFLHRTIWCWHHDDPGRDWLVDHIDGNPANNRIENLRLVTPGQNQVNRRRPRIDSEASKYLGVCAAGTKFNAFASNGTSKPIYLGIFADEREAAVARDAATWEKYREYATLNRDLFPEDFLED